MQLSDTNAQVRDAARAFAENAIRPVAEALDAEERFPGDLYEEMGELGLFGICVPEEMGGPGLDTQALRARDGRAFPGIFLGRRPVRVDRVDRDPSCAARHRGAARTPAR